MTLEDITNKANQMVGTDLDKRHGALWLLLEFLNIDNTTYHMHKNSSIPKEQCNKYFKMLNLYIEDNIPVQYIIGHSYFYGRRFVVSKDTLIPRSETEYLVENVLSLKEKYFSDQTLDILDMGTGSGAIGITLKLESKDDNLILSDISEEALKVAHENKKIYDVDVEIVKSDWFNNINRKFDIIVANPPYVSDEFLIDDLVSKEPKEALFGGTDGLDPYRIILKNASKYIKNKAIIAFEHGYDHKKALKELSLKNFPESLIIQKKDLGKRDRYTFVIIGDENE